MPGNKTGGMKARDTNRNRYGEDFYKSIGGMGGRTSRSTGFGATTVGKDGLTGPERAKIVGATIDLRKNAGYNPHKPTCRQNEVPRMTKPTNSRGKELGKIPSPRPHDRAETGFKPDGSTGYQGKQAGGITFDEAEPPQGELVRGSFTPETLAEFFHETYERLAPDYSYKTRKASAVPWADVPSLNKQLMIHVAGEVLDALAHPNTTGGKEYSRGFEAAGKTNWAIQQKLEEKAYQAGLDAALEALPEEVDTDGAGPGKWPNGWNDYQAQARQAITKKKEEK